MKYLSFVSSLCFFLLFSVQTQAQHDHGNQQDMKSPELKTETGDVTEVFMVYGNCGMCERRIERTLSSLEGVRSADWDVDSKMATVVYDGAATSPDAMKEKLAAVGHDTDKFKASKEVYGQLPGCCQYERPKN